MQFSHSIGINIEKQSVSIVYLKKSFKGIQLAGTSVYSFDSDITLSEKLDVIGNIVSDFIKERNIYSAGIFLGIPRELSVLKYIKFPIALKENLKTSLRYEMEKYVPFTINDIYYDYSITKEDKKINQLSILLAVVKKSDLLHYIDLKDRLSHGISGIEIRSSAILNYFFHKKEANLQNNYGIIYWQNNGVEFIFFDKSGIINSKYIDISNKETDKLKTVIEEIKALKASSLYLYIDEQLKDISIALTNEFKDSLKINEPDSFNLPSINCIPAFGLSLKGLQKVYVNMNIMPVQFRKMPSRINFYIMIALIILSLLTGLSWIGVNLFNRRMLLNEVNNRISKLGADIANIDKVQTQIDELDKKIIYLNSMQNNRLSVTNILKELTNIIPETAYINELQFSKNDIQISGFAESASELIHILENSPFFKDAAFLNAITKEKDGKEGKERFRIGCKLE